MIISIETALSVHVTLYDPAHASDGGGDGEWYQGLGSIDDSTGALTATLTHTLTHNTVTVSGTFVKQDSTITRVVSLAGDVVQSNLTCTTRATGSGQYPFAGNWSGTYSGTEYGSWSTTFASNGTVSGEALSPTCGDVTINGTCSSGGQETASGTGTCGWTITWQGILFYLSDGTAHAVGKWHSNSGFNGTWTGSE